MTVEDKAKEYYRKQMILWPRALSWYDLSEETKTYFIDRIQTSEDFNARHGNGDIQ